MRQLCPGRAAAVLAFAVFLCALTPATAEARVTITFEYYYAGAVAGGVGIVIYVSQAFDLGLAPEGKGPALLLLRGRALEWGIPLPEAYELSSEDDSGGPPGWSLPVLRWEF